MEINVIPNRKLNVLKISFVGAYTFCIVTFDQHFNYEYG